MSSPPPVTPRERFRELDPYRVQREWDRYEGTAQRDLFRELRERFLKRHSAAGGSVLEVGPGPGRFTPFVGRSPVRRVLLDLSQEMLQEARRRSGKGRRGPEAYQLVRGDLVSPPLTFRAFSEVVVLGNTVGFAGSESSRALDAATELVAPGGILLLELAAGDGERSTYLRRLPPGAFRRLFTSPPRLVAARVRREGFEPEPPKPADRHGFSRRGGRATVQALERRGFTVEELLAVAPATGALPDQLSALGSESAEWPRLISLEEEIGHDPPRAEIASAVLIAARRP